MSGYEVRPDGTIVAQTPEDAIRLSEMLRKRGRSTVSQPATATGPSVIGPDDGMRRVIKALVESGDGLETPDLVTRARLKSGRSMASISSVIKMEIAKRAPGRAVKDFIWREKRPGRQHPTWRVNASRLREIGLVA